MKTKILPLILTLLFAFIWWYFVLPPLNLSSPLFWFYLGIVVLFGIFVFGSSLIADAFNRRSVNVDVSPIWKYLAIGGVSIVLIIVVVDVICSPLFNSQKYSSRIVVDETGNFADDISEVDLTKIPLLDKDSSSKLGDRIMGQQADWVSQFYVSDMYTQINYNDEIMRVTPIEYDGIIKYFSNRSDGIKGYITVDSVTGEAKLVTLDEGMRYMPSAYFFENLERKLRISYPTTIFDDPYFEIDNEGKPYWVVPTIKYVGVGLKKEVNGVVILDAVTGESKRYDVDDVPTWIDHVYPADLIIEELDNWGEYKNGFFNSIFGQKNVVNTTDGYNYLVLNDDVYLYTGITSVVSDESNLGFVLVNLRTKETNYYSAAGAEEYSAMASAEGLVQEKRYNATFPLLVNIQGRPTYLLSLKDDAGLVKMYALVDVSDYQKVVVSDVSLGIDVAVSKYVSVIGDVVSGDVIKKEIVINSITAAVVDGNTYYYIVDSDDNKYSVSIKVNDSLLPFLRSGDKVNISYNEGNVSDIITIEGE